MHKYILNSLIEGKVSVISHPCTGNCSKHLFNSLIEGNAFLLDACINFKTMKQIYQDFSLFSRSDRGIRDILSLWKTITWRTPRKVGHRSIPSLLSPLFGYWSYKRLSSSFRVEMPRFILFVASFEGKILISIVMCVS